MISSSSIDASRESLAVARMLFGLLKSCPICSSTLSGHEYALLATCVVPSVKDDTLLGFFEAIKDHQWGKLREFRTWLGKSDNVEAYAIRCSAQLAVTVTKTHFELLQGSRLLYSEIVSQEERVKLYEAFTELPWHPF